MFLKRLFDMRWLIVGLILLSSIIFVIIISSASTGSKPINLVISNVYVSDITSDSAIINWKTNKKTDSIVRFRTFKDDGEGYQKHGWDSFQVHTFDSDYNKLEVATDFSNTTNHNVSLNNLESGARCYFEIIASTKEYISVFTRLKSGGFNESHHFTTEK